MAGLDPPDISPYASGSDTVPYATTLSSSVSGPHAAIFALVHGNELCGADALTKLLTAGLRPARGRLSLVFANIAAFQSFDRAMPDRARFLDEDFNRVWTRETLDGPRQSRELVRARALRPLVDKIDVLLDLHSMQTPSPPMALAGLQPKGLTLARTIGAPATIVMDGGPAGGTRMRDYAGFADPGNHKTSVLVECGQHYDLGSRAVALEVALRFLLALGMIERAWAERLMPLPTPPAQRVVAVTDAINIRTDRFTFVRPFVGMEVIAKAGTVIADDDGQAVVTPYDDCVLIMPTLRQRPGLTAVRLGRFVA